MLLEKIEECRENNPNLEYTYLLQATAQILKNAGLDIEAEELNRDWHHLMSVSVGAKDIKEVATNFIGWIQTYGYPTEVDRLLANRLPVFRIDNQLSYVTLRAWEKALEDATRDLGIRRNSKSYWEFIEHYAPTAGPKILDEAQYKINTTKSFIEQNTREVRKCLEAAQVFIFRLKRLVEIVTYMQIVSGVGDQGKTKVISDKITKIQTAIDSTIKSLAYYNTLSFDPHDIVSRSIAGYDRLEDLWKIYKETKDVEGKTGIIN